MKVLAIEKDVEGVTDEAFTDEVLREEAGRAWELFQEGVIRELYFRADRHAAVLVLECGDATAAERALATLPLVQRGLIAFELIPLAPYPGFSRLFSPPA